MSTDDVQRAMRGVIDAVLRWREARGKWYKSRTDRNANNWHDAEQRLSEAISAYERAKRIETAAANSGERK